ncbi:MAG: flippase-like protein, partial [Microbacteriaceae bacterium]|nr:flippase-like protein [Microbacteriaceae bacterium]
IACHAATFTIATAAVGESVPPPKMLALAFVILLGASIPLNIGGWGPREGIAGWAFALAGFGASTGVAASTLFGVLAIISVAPGAIVMVVFAARQRKANNAVPSTAPRSRLRESLATPRAPIAPVLVLSSRNEEKTS